FCVTGSSFSDSEIQRFPVSGENEGGMHGHSKILPVGQQCVLSCRLQPAESVADKSVEWTRADLDPTYVLIYRQRRLEPKEVNPSFKERTELFEQGPEKGDMSLKLNYPKLSDTGTYTCKLVMDVSSQFSLEVPVGAVSEPQITLERSLDKLVFKCEVRNWYPKPEMEWRDSKEQIVPHEDISPVQDDEYFSIVSRITVEMWASDNYTCTVRQLGIRETRKTNFTVPGKSALVKFTMIIAESLSIALKGPIAGFSDTMQQPVCPPSNFRIWICLNLIVFLNGCASRPHFPLRWEIFVFLSLKRSFQ
uniref:Ig-like domain-containing protein n=1 Tax=Labrus bergylta TaxID=56723 RepID=A0A3Q3KWQ8_9LABR